MAAFNFTPNEDEMLHLFESQDKEAAANTVKAESRIGD